MKRCIHCSIAHEQTDKYCMKCGSPSIFEVRYASLQEAMPADIVYRANLHKRGPAAWKHAVLGDVKEVHADDTVTVLWRNLRVPQRMPAKSLGLTARYTELIEVEHVDGSIELVHW